MNQRDLEFRLVSWLDDGPEAAPRDVVEAALADARTIRQVGVLRLPLGRPRLVLPTYDLARASAALAVAVAVAVLALWSFNRAPIPPATSPTPSVTSSPSALPSGSTSGSLLPTVSPAEPTPKPTKAPGGGPPAHTATPATASPVPTATPTPSLPTTMSPPPPPSPTVVNSLPPPIGWSQLTRIASEGYSNPSMVLDAQDHVHAAFVFGSSIYYFSDELGDWNMTPLSSLVPGEQDMDPSIAIDTDGTIYVAWASYINCVEGCGHEESLGVRMQVRRNGAWSGVTTIGNAGDESPSIAVRDGVLHLATARWVEPTGWAPFYSTSDGLWHGQQLAPKGLGPDLKLGSDGRSHILFTDGLQSYYVQPSTGLPPTVEVGPALGFASMTLDPADTPHVVGNIGTVPYYSHRETDGTWSPPIELSMPTYATAIAAADAEHAFIASYFDLAHTGIWYTRPGGDPGQLMNVSGFSTSQAIAASAVALDSLGRPHVLFNVPNFDIPEFGMWYAVGPEPANW